MLEHSKTEPQVLKDEELEQVAGGITDISMNFGEDAPDADSESIALRKKTYIHGTIKAPENAGFATGQKCGGTIRYYKGAFFRGYECDRCGEFWRLVDTRTDSEILYSGSYFNLG